MCGDAVDLPSHPDASGSSQGLLPGASQHGSQQQQHEHSLQQPQQQAHQHQHQQVDGAASNGERLSEQYDMEIAEMRHRLRHTGAQPSVDQFSDADLLRHVRATGLLKVAAHAQHCIAPGLAVVLYWSHSHSHICDVSDRRVC